MRIPIVRSGDSTTTGGTVYAVKASIHDNGIKIALDGEHATCGNCDGSWPISGSGEGMSNKGIRVVIDGDHVLCPCGTNRVVAGADARCFIHKTQDVANAARTFAPSLESGHAARYDEQFTDSMVHVTINTTPICPNMTNQEFRQTMMKVKSAAVVLVMDRIAAVARWDSQERVRAATYFGRADDGIRNALATGLPRLLSSLQELVPEKIVRWDDSMNRNLSCAVVADGGQNRAGVCKPDSERRVIAIYSAFCADSNGELWHGAKVKTIIHECTHYTDTFNSDDIMYGNTESGMHAFALCNADKAIRNADSITGYIATFDRTVAR